MNNSFVPVSGERILTSRREGNRGAISERERFERVRRGIERRPAKLLENAGMGKTAVLVGGGTSAEFDLDEVVFLKARGAHVIAINSAYPSLLDKNIIPDGAVFVDPRAWIADYLTDVLPDVTYIAASQCHDAFWSKLDRHSAQSFVYHVAQKNSDFDHFKRMPGMDRHWITAMGNTSGTRALEMCLGGKMHYDGVKLSGFDGSTPHGEMYWYKKPDSAALDTAQLTRPMRLRDHMTGEVLATDYYTNHNMRIQMAFMEKDLLTIVQRMQAGTTPRTKIEFMGFGMLPDFAAIVGLHVDYEARRKVLLDAGKTREIAEAPLQHSDTVSDDYAVTNRALHVSDERYGVSSSKWISAVAATAYKRKLRNALDYGAGKGLLKRGLAVFYPPLKVDEYDPCIPGLDAQPQPTELVICTDVMEHIEPDKLCTVLDHLQSLAQKALFCTISTRPAEKVLADGRNAHLSLHTPEVWRDMIEARFKIIEWHVNGPEIAFLAEPKEWPSRQ